MLWVRTQSLRSLFYCSCFYIRDNVIFGLATDGDEIPLGSYSNDEECIYVLNDISTFICNNVKDLGFVSGVYVMPSRGFLSSI